MYQFTDSIDPREHDAFVSAHPLCNLLQSSAWAEVKSNWDHQIVGMREGTALIASALVLIRRLPLGLCMMYVPRGPIMDYTDRQMTQRFFDALKRWAKKQRCIFIKMDPGILLRSYPFGSETPDADPAALRCIDNIKAAGAVHHGFPLLIKDSVQPRFAMGVAACDDLDKHLPQATIRSRNVALRKNVKVYEATKEELHQFAEVMHSTENRKHIHLRDEEYFRKLMNAYGKHAHLFLARIDAPAYLKGLQMQAADIQEQLADPQLGRKATRKLNQQLDQLTKEMTSVMPLAEKYPQECVAAGGLMVGFGTTMEMLYAGMNEDFHTFRPQYLIYCTQFAFAFQHGYQYVSMGGVEGTLDDGLSIYKANFNPIVQELVGEFDLPIRPLIHRIGMWLLKKHG
ncbi:MAG TPA: aminoacyltransferase [Candidatus Merdibacter merdavium]|uniref:Aminoacyltransferase n=1 Tax=Candidatus Merdibacter merdavium TaxID=2838692 RepID=A0A9D2NS85_9FIRM|nr:aminoacyltransferase [Candidatus Merdibacter merdavium]